MDDDVDQMADYEDQTADDFDQVADYDEDQTADDFDDQVADDDDEDDLVQGGLDGDIESGQVGHIGETGKVVREVGHLKQHHLSDD